MTETQMKPAPQFVTFTGVDERTDIGRLRSISERWPVEWGILFSKKRSGNEPRYPALDFLGDVDVSGLRLAAHLCGSLASDAVDHAGAGIVRLPDWLLASLDGNFDRIQFNVENAEGLIENVRGADDAIAEMARYAGATRAIVQCHGPAFPASTKVDWLYDRSAGTGQEQTRWPPGETPHSEGGRASIGYAGGIGPESVERVLAAVHSEVPFSIDMETRIRTDDWLDLDLCETVCRKVFG